MPRVCSNAAARELCSSEHVHPVLDIQSLSDTSFKLACEIHQMKLSEILAMDIQLTFCIENHLQHICLQQFTQMDLLYTSLSPAEFQPAQPVPCGPCSKAI